MFMIICKRELRGAVEINLVKINLEDLEEDAGASKFG